MSPRGLHLADLCESGTKERGKQGYAPEVRMLILRGSREYRQCGCARDTAEWVMPQPGSLSAKPANMYPHVHVHTHSLRAYNMPRAHMYPHNTHIFIHRCRYMYFCVYAGPHTFHMYACVHTCRHVQASMLSVYLLVFVYLHMCTHSLLASPFSSAVLPSLPHADLSPADSYLVLIACATLGTSKQGCTRV